MDMELTVGIQRRNLKETILSAHHIVWTSRGGKDSIYNLITLCVSCHDKVHETGQSGNVKIKGGKVVTGMDGWSDKIAQRTMQGKAYLYDKLSQIASLSKVFGYQTSETRKSLGFPKSHSIDALCVAIYKTG